MKILKLQNAGGFYGDTLVVLDDKRAEIVREKLLNLTSPVTKSDLGFIKLGDDGVVWEIKEVDPTGVAVFVTGGEKAEARILKAIGL